MVSDEMVAFFFWNLRESDKTRHNRDYKRDVVEDPQNRMA